MVLKNTLIKIFSIFLVIVFCFQFLFVFADDIELEEENFDIAEEIQKYENFETVETSSSDNDNISLNARSAIVLDRTSKKILYGKNEYRKVKMASTTKIMTAIVILENCDLSQTTQVSKKAAGTGGSRLGLKVGDKITINDLLYGLLLCSGNDAAVCLAETCSGSVKDFSNLMNLKAKELGLKNSHFETPHGLDSDEHYTTAYELALLTNYALENPIFKKIVGTKLYTITINGYELAKITDYALNNKKFSTIVNTKSVTIHINGYAKALNNTNELLGNLNGVYGVKTGFTNGANRCLVTACKRNNMDIICVVLGCDTKKFRTNDSIKLIEYAFNNFEYVNIKNIIDEKFSEWKKENLDNIHIIKSIDTNLSIKYSNLDTPIIPIKKEDASSIEINFKLNSYLEAPIYKDTKLGTIFVMSNGLPVIECDILTDCEIKRKNIFYYFYDLFRQIKLIPLDLQK